ncbi:MAG: hypothetical protein ABSA52_23020 [Candidatus Binatia bacterium]
MKAVILVGLIVALLSYSLLRRATAQKTPTTATDVLRSRPGWKNLPASFLDALAGKLETSAKASEFAKLCEDTGILKNNISRLARFASGTDAPETAADAQRWVEFAVSAVAATLTDYAGAMMEREQLQEAKQGLELSLLLKPRQFNAWSSMALVASHTGDCKTAVFWADKFLTDKPDPASSDPWERAAADFMTAQGNRKMEEELGPDVIRAARAIREEMERIRRTCRK